MPVAQSPCACAAAECQGPSTSSLPSSKSLKAAGHQHRPGPHHALRDAQPHIKARLLSLCLPWLCADSCPCLQLSFGPISWLIVGEVFPLSVRGPATALATLTNFGSNFLVRQHPQLGLGSRI